MCTQKRDFELINLSERIEQSAKKMEQRRIVKNMNIKREGGYTTLDII